MTSKAMIASNTTIKQISFYPNQALSLPQFNCSIYRSPLLTGSIAEYMTKLAAESKVRGENTLD